MNKKMQTKAPAPLYPRSIKKMRTTVIFTCIAVSLCFASCEKSSKNVPCGSGLTRIDEEDDWAYFCDIKGEPVLFIYVKVVKNTPARPVIRGRSCVSNGIVTFSSLLELDKNQTIQVEYSSAKSNIVEIGDAEYSLDQGKVFLARVDDGKVKVKQLSVAIPKMKDATENDSLRKAAHRLAAENEIVKTFVNMKQ